MIHSNLCKKNKINKCIQLSMRKKKKGKKMNKHLPQVLPRGNHHIIVLAFIPKFIVVK